MTEKPADSKAPWLDLHRSIPDERVVATPSPPDAEAALADVAPGEAAVEAPVAPSASDAAWRKTRPAGAAKAPVRLVATAWGEKYVDHLLSYALPALQAPGNLPALAEHFDCDLVLVVEEKMFDAVRRSRAWRALTALCGAELRPVDDLAVPSTHYGVTLTRALFRGFEELGPAMTDHHLLFLNADFVLGDGSYRSLVDRLRAGERLIHAPSYCVIEEQVASLLAARRNRRTGVLAIPSRAMARMILDHRHLTIRAKTINQPAYAMHRFDQFYWDAGDHALLARQMPIALVAMRPERVVRTMRTFWDYGVVSEFFETPRPCVLGDSDDFLMLELREANIFADLFRFGRPSIDEIAKDLSTFTTKDQRDHAGFTLVVHDEDLPASVEQDRRALDAFVSQVVERLSLPVDHLDHAFWRPAMAGFEERRAEFLRTGKARPAGPPPAGGAVAPATTADAAPRTRPSLADRAYRTAFGRLPFVKPTHPYHAMVQDAYRVLDRELVKPQRKVLVISTQGETLSTFVRTRAAADATIVEWRGLWDVAQEHGTEGAASRLARGGPIDLCVCELALPDLLRLNDIWRMVRPFMAPDGVVVALHLNRTGQDLRPAQHALIQALPVGQCRVSFAGSRLTRWALGFFHLGASMRGRGRLATRLAVVGAALTALPLAVAGNLGPRRAGGGPMPRDCLSITIEYRRQ